MRRQLLEGLRRRAPMLAGVAAVCFATRLGWADSSPTSEHAPGADGSAETAPTPHRLSWEPHTRFRPTQYIIAFGTPVLFRLIDENTREASRYRWRGPVPLDTAARDLLRVDDEDGQRRATQLSDYGWYGAMAWPLFDAVVVALALDQNVDVAWQLSALALQAYALSGFVTLVTIKATARQRPADDGCGDGPDTPGCSPPRSFPSGHTAGAFAGAGLVCASHLNLPLYGSAAADLAACIGALTFAGTTAVLRVSADRHYASDVIVGAGIGATVGYVLPALFQYTTGERSDQRLAIVPNGRGAYLLTYGGSF